MNKIKYLIDLYTNVYENKGLLKLPIVPETMRNGSEDSEGWIPWKPIPSTITITDISKFEKNLGYTLPKLYKDYLQYKHLLEFDLGWLNLYTCNSENSIKDIEDVILHNDVGNTLLHNGYIIIGQDSEFVSYLSLDTSYPLKNDYVDYPVVLVEYSPHNIHILQHIASSFEDLVDQMINTLSNSD
jgi:hypothetical protein